MEKSDNDLTEARTEKLAEVAGYLAAIDQSRNAKKAVLEGGKIVVIAVDSGEKFVLPSNEDITSLIVLELDKICSENESLIEESGVFGPQD